MKDLIGETVKNLSELDEHYKLLESVVDTNVHKLEEMGEIANLQQNIYICVYAKEGYIPHFHIYTGSKHNRRGERKKSMKSACLKFEENAYFAHNDDCKDKLTNEELEVVMNILREPNKDDDRLTNWEACILNWNLNNASIDKKKRLDRNIKMPNYKDPRYPK